MLHDHSPNTMASQIPIPEVDPEPQPHINETLDDVFGSEPADFSESGEGNKEWSDIPRIKAKHETEGYRDGVTRGKAETVQKGFDEGYTLGAILGLRVGKLIGMVQGIHAAVSSAKEADGSDKWKAEHERLEGLWGSAQEELTTKVVFGRAYFGMDGIWTYPVEAEGEEIVFPDVANSHPLVRKWEDIIAAEARRWKLDLAIMDNEEANENARSAIAKNNAQEGKIHNSGQGLEW